MDFVVDAHLLEDSRIGEWPIKFPMQHGFEVDRLLTAVFEKHL